MGLPTFRAGDATVCPGHGGGSAADEPSTVHVNGRPLRRIGNAIGCGPSADKLSSGASLVLLGGRPVGRVAERTQHNGVVMGGSPNVIVGSPSAYGCAAQLSATCKAMAAGRPTNQTNQSYSNCGIESMRQLLHQAGIHKGEDELLDRMELHYISAPVRAARTFSGGDSLRGKLPGDDPSYGRGSFGGSYPDEQAQALTELGLPTSTQPTTPEGIEAAIREGKGVIINVWAGDIWPPSAGFKPGKGAHSITVSGIEYDDQGHVASYITNDTGLGSCGRRVPASKLNHAFMGIPMAVTDGPLW